MQGEGTSWMDAQSGHREDTEKTKEESDSTAEDTVGKVCWIDNLQVEGVCGMGRQIIEALYTSRLTCPPTLQTILPTITFQHHPW